MKSDPVINFEFVRNLTQFILEHATDYEWSIQGFGMLRLYIPGAGRLNIWDSRFRVPDVSMIHTHPWNFDSLIERGYIQNQRYIRTDYAGENYSFAKLKPGIGGGLLTTSEYVHLLSQPVETYKTGDWYHQQADEIHISLPEDGAVTLNLRHRVAADEALVFWPRGQNWVDAMPRIATKDEISAFAEKALVTR